MLAKPAQVTKDGALPAGSVSVIPHGASLVPYGWSPAFASPTPVGWVVVLGYFLAAGLCLRNARAARQPARLGPGAFFRARAQRRVWLTLAVLLFVLGLNKQIDLQTLVTSVGREAARQRGWYDERRPLQRELIALVGLIATVLCGFLGVAVRRAGSWAIVATATTVLLCAFILVRAASLHAVDGLLARGVAGLTVNRVVETGAIALDAIAALLARHCLLQERSTDRWSHRARQR